MKIIEKSIYEFTNSCWYDHREGCMLCSSCRTNDDSQVLRKRLSCVLFFSGYQQAARSTHTREMDFFTMAFLPFFRGAAIKISRKLATSLSFHRYSYKHKI